MFAADLKFEPITNWPHFPKGTRVVHIPTGLTVEELSSSQLVAAKEGLKKLKKKVSKVSEKKYLELEVLSIIEKHLKIDVWNEANGVASDIQVRIHTQDELKNLIEELKGLLE